MFMVPAGLASRLLLLRRDGGSWLGEVAFACRAFDSMTTLSTRCGFPEKDRACNIRRAAALMAGTRPCEDGNGAWPFALEAEATNPMEYRHERCRLHRLRQQGYHPRHG